ncbi:uncharacterized protein BO80DRAFT_369183 [Aspergillus ibericus CBS 121593]|uniref:Rhodopsin domain-containing protein n=1 Tax=Aspergillus ibericus CBS 121593 TaxID=1448316 RepID=A0A395GIK1_9EURO|nr:hypothetical protein BO80DRAFT_369183 [Aspergillus ibericus CBS 121593]RAK95281.1 hypothetical protein BO80DRAFT_369183 [Aspergillus ibericus CBS 121593]
MDLPLRLANLFRTLHTRTIDIRASYPASQPPPDHVDEIAIATLYLMVMMILAVVIRLAFRLYMLRSLQWDDGIVSLSLVFAVAQCISILVGTRHGLGKRESALSDKQVHILEKALYAADLFYVLALSLAKVSVLHLLNKLTVNKVHKQITCWTSMFVGIWTVPVFFALVFKCGAPNPWDTSQGHCIHIFIFWAAIAPIDIITDLLICILPIYIVKPVQVVIGKKATVVFAFSIRILNLTHFPSVIITMIIRLIFLRHAPPSPDVSDAAFATIITTECVLCVSLMTACIPCLKPFLDAFDSGMLNISLHKRIGGGSNSNSYGNSYALTSMSKGVKESATHSRFMEDEVEGLGTSAAAFAVTPPGVPFTGRNSGLAIQRTDQWSVRCEYVDPKAGSIDETEGEESSVGRGEEFVGKVSVM